VKGVVNSPCPAVSRTVILVNKIKRNILLFGVIVWFLIVILFLGYGFFEVVSEKTIFQPQKENSRLSEYGFYVIFLIGLFILKFWLDGKAPNKDNRGFWFILKTVVASYMLSFVLSMMILVLIYFTVNPALFGIYVSSLQLVVLVGTLALCPFVYRSLK